MREADPLRSASLYCLSGRASTGSRQKRRVNRLLAVCFPPICNSLGHPSVRSVSLSMKCGAKSVPSYRYDLRHEIGSYRALACISYILSSGVPRFGTFKGKATIRAILGHLVTNPDDQRPGYLRPTAKHTASWRLTIRALALFSSVFRARRPTRHAARHRDSQDRSAPNVARRTSAPIARSYAEWQGDRRC